MEDYIYIIVGLVWVAYSLYSARQKAIKKQQSAGMPSRGPSQSSPLPIPGSGGKSLLEDIFREFAGEPAPVPQPSQTQKPFYGNTEEESLETFRPYKSSKVKSSISGQTTTSPKIEPENDGRIHPILKQMTKNEPFAKKFNLREAVIFSELLNRKYF
jgi:hypothetical protein